MGQASGVAGAGATFVFLFGRKENEPLIHLPVAVDVIVIEIEGIKKTRALLRIYFYRLLLDLLGSCTW
jgi:hypothetical protein